ncbi:MAG: cyclic nucleotide-binding domain-containing protein, partial [Fidelibacterota bacterium]
IFRFTIHDTTQQLLWLPVPSHQKNRAKPFIDGSVKNGAQGISGLLILAMVYFFDVRYLSIPALLLIILWTMSNLRLKKEYILELGKAIEKRRLDFESLEIDITDPSIVNTLKDALMKGDDSQKLFALDTLKNLPLSPWIPHLRQLFQSGSPLIVRQVADLARSDTRIVSDDDIITLTKTRDDAVAAEAMIICGERKLTKAVDRLRMELRTENPRRRSAAAAGILLMGSDTDGQAERALHSMLFDPHNETQIAALKSTGRLPHLVTDEGLATLLADDSPDVRRLAADLAAERTNPALIEPLVENLRNATTALNARRALTSYDPGSVLSTLLRRLGNGRTQDDLAVGIIRCLGDYPRLSAVNALIEWLDDSPSPVAREITDTLLKMAQKNPLSDDQSHRLDGILGNVIRRLYSHLDLLHRFQKEDPDFLLEDLILTMIQREQTEILKLSLVPFPHSPVETLHHTLMSGSPRARANGLEILDNLLPRETREKILPLFDDSPLEEKIKMGQHLYPTAAVPEETALVGWLQSASRWTSAVALRYILTYDRLEAVLTAPGAGAINWNQLSRSNLNREVVSAAWDGNGSALQQLPDFPKQRFLLEEMPMYSTLEKTIFMKGVDLFQDIPGEEVSHAAQIAQEVQLPSEEPIFHEGDPGDSMFIIVAGKVRIHKSGRSAEGQREIAVLSKGEFMGEMALLDQEPRSASATTLEDTVLLRISGEDFYDLMASRVDIMHGIVRVLTKRLRGAIS